MALKTAVVTLLFLHALMHVIGVLKSMGIADIEAVTQAIPRHWGIVWGACALLLAGAAIARMFEAGWWWGPAAVGLIVSQVVIAAFWADAKFGTVANVLLLLPVALGFGAWRFEVGVSNTVAELEACIPKTESKVVKADELASLPLVVRRWLHASGVVGRPRDRRIQITQAGELQTDPHRPWLLFRARQCSVIDDPAFVWIADVDAGYGLHLAGNDTYVNGAGSIRIELQSLIPIVNASGANIDQGALIRFLAEIVWCPSAALEPYVSWQAIDDNSARAVMRHRGAEGSGVFHFSANGDVLRIEARRYRGDVMEDWIVENDPESFAVMDGVRTPCRSTNTWRTATGERWTWLRLEVTALTRNVKCAR